jgi:hypothetical protein
VRTVDSLLSVLGLLVAAAIAVSPAIAAAPAPAPAGAPVTGTLHRPASKAAVPLPHGGPVPPRGAPHLSQPLHGPQVSPALVAKPGSTKPTGLAAHSLGTLHVNPAPGTHPGVLGGPATNAAKRAGVVRGTGLRRRPTAP